MADRLSERERRALAEAEKDDFDVESAEPVVPKRLGQMVSLRLDPDVAIAVRDIAAERGISLSDLLREAVARVIVDASQSMRVTNVEFSVVNFPSPQIAPVPPPTGGWASGEYLQNAIEVTAAA